MRRLTLFALALAATTAHAHITLETPTAEAGSTYKGVLRIGHGCDGSPTTGIRLIVPAGVQQLKPMPKAGWTLTVKKDKLEQPYDYYGETVREDTSAVIWSDGSLPDAFYDEFAFRARLPATPGSTLYFKIEQRCAKGETRWVEVPAAGQDPHALKAPAAMLKLTAPGAAHQH
ncbi:YcnI family protein [Crenobacter sp. SG2305]|uniref:YcnI family copper-binding membrane protein n=1 Tax=Crenobacter oryzisoli TaxID=3056844 RepID=UPI0025AAF3D3|nr:YcnI family protein [Crenobacter sp. SG2305]MDN0083838.1 YcnI family protein [Crenobacter sp. SG2305]